MALKIKFGTDGWRAIIAKEYTTDNVARVAKATALWLKENNKAQKVVIGHDYRFGGAMFVETATKVMCAEGIKVFVADDVATTPMISLGAKELGCGQGVVITASHNPPTYNGYKLKSEIGGPSTPSVVEQVENLIPDTTEIPTKTLAEFEAEGLIEKVDLSAMYLKAVENAFDLEAIRNANFGIAYDAMYGAGQVIIDKILPNATKLHCEYNPSFMGQAPEPLHKNLLELSETIAKDSNLHVGLANDGDADRIGMYDENGNFVDSHHLILLLIHYLHKYKGLTGKVVNAFSVTDRVRKMCELYGLEYQVTKVGFKYICEIMANDDVLLGGEESGGIAVKGFIPERDGIWMGLLIFEMMAKTGKTMTELVQEVYDVVGGFVYQRNDLRLTNEIKNAIIENCKAGKYNAFGDYQVERLETVDGFKYFLNENDWLMIRPSGTEPVLRVYAEGSSQEAVLDILAQAEATILS